MDHVPYPENPALPLIDINYICGDIEEYDGLGFIDYPVRRGWTRTSRSPQWMDCSWEIAAKRAQSWLYFGFLHEILGREYNKGNFLRHNPNGVGFLVDTSKLPNLLSNWSRFRYQRWFWILGLNRSVASEFVNRSRQICQEVNLQSDLLDHVSWECRIITLGIKILLQSVQTAICNIERDEGQSIMVTNRVSPAKLTYLRMVKAGWCRKQASHLLTSCSVIGSHYLAALPRKYFGTSHEDCKIELCVANSVDEKHYKVSHTEEDCQCPFIGPEISEVIKQIGDGNIPLLSITVTSDGDPRIQVLKASQPINYTAISHVWIGGLGNFSQNELPICELLRIRRLLKNLKIYKSQQKNPDHIVSVYNFSIFRKAVRILKGITSLLQSLCRRKDPSRSYLELSSLEEKDPVVFWMDTLCIPVGEENSLLRADAINKMDLIYAGAEDVLVLDPELQQISLQGLAQEQISAHILCSPWMTRCWTLQEARLSSNWYAQFADGIFDPRSAHERLIKDIVPFFAFNNVWDDLRNLKHEMFNDWYYEQLPKRNTSEFGISLTIDDPFHSEWNNLIRRSTTKKEDIHCILANMLGLSAGETLALSYEERMKAILRTQARLPLHLLVTEGPRIQDVYNRWVPSYPETLITGKYGHMHVTANGLVFDQSNAGCRGLLVASSMPRLNKFCLLDASNSSELFWVSLGVQDVDPGFQVPTRIGTCYILGELKDSRFVQLHELGKATVGVHGGACFAVQRHEGGILHLLYEHPFKYHYSRPRDYDSNNRYVEDQSEYPTIHAERLAANQVYQIDCDMDSWPKITNRRELIEEMSGHEYDIFGLFMNFSVLCVWFLFGLLSGLSINSSGLTVGLLSILLIRLVWGWIIYRKLRTSLDRRANDIYVCSYETNPTMELQLLENDSSNSNHIKSLIFLQSDFRQLALGLSAATVLIVVGAKFPRQNWVWWMGLAIPVELVLRLALEVLWQRTEFGSLATRWVKQQSWWSDEVMLERA